MILGITLTTLLLIMGLGITTQVFAQPTSNATATNATATNAGKYFVLIQTTDPVVAKNIAKQAVKSSGGSSSIDEPKVDRAFSAMSQGGASSLASGDGSEDIRGCIKIFGWKACTPNIGGPDIDVTLGIG